MSWKKFRLVELFGLPVRVHLSWLVVAGLVIWSLATGLFPMLEPGWPTIHYWIMGLSAAAALLISIVTHELAHSLAARQLGMSIKSITLYFFGGVAELENRPPSATSELLMALMGPAASFALASLSYLASAGAHALGAHEQVLMLLEYTMVINFLIGGFNLLPAFPLDGGRVLRAVIWGATGRLEQATRISTWIGAGLGIAVISLGAIISIDGELFAGACWILLGVVVLVAALQARREALAER
jgi:Zn-dependent protease